MGTVHARVRDPAVVGRDTRASRGKGSGEGAGTAWACNCPEHGGD